MKLKAKLMPLQGKYYGTHIMLKDEEEREFGTIKVWLPYDEYGIDAISPRELETEEFDPGFWDYSHSESKVTYEVAITIVNAINNGQ